MDSRREGEREKGSAGERGDKEQGIGGARESESEEVKSLVVAGGSK